MSAFLASARTQLHLGKQSPTSSLMAADVHRLLSLLRQPISDSSKETGPANDLWQIVGLGRNEVQTARVLTWLLDPRGSHGMGLAFLTSFWQQIPKEIRPFEVTSARRAMRETVPLGNAKNRIDIEIEGDDFLVFVEVKIDAVEGERQVVRYQALATQKARLRSWEKFAVVLLAPFTPGTLPPHCFHMNWQDVSRAIEKAVRVKRNNPKFSAALALSFAEHIRKL